MMLGKRFDAACFVGLLISLFAASANAADWVSFGGSSKLIIQAEGDAASSNGARLVVKSEIGDEQGAALTSVAAENFRGHTIELAGQLSSGDQLGMTSLWMRIEGPDGRLGFITSEGRAPVASVQPVRHSVSLGVPSNASRIVFGVALSGSGQLQVTDLKLETLSSGSDVSYEELMREAVGILKQHAYYVDRINWSGNEEGFSDSSGSFNRIDAHVEISRLIAQLSDGHSMHLPRGEDNLGESHLSDLGIRSGVSDDGAVGYLNLPSVSGRNHEVRSAYVEQVCAAIAAGQARGVQSWIVDLRENAGGTMWPMLQGIKPLLGAGAAGYFVDRSGERKVWEIEDGCTGVASPSKVAVLLGSETASAGEAVAVAFSGRSGARSFGERTAGQANANRSFELSDGSVLLVMSSLYADRTGRVLTDSFVYPDDHVSSGSDVDAVRSAAERWLLTP